MHVASFVVCIVGKIAQDGSRDGVKVLWCDSHLVIALYHLTLAVAVFIMYFVSAAAFLPCHSKLCSASGCRGVLAMNNIIMLLMASISVELPENRLVVRVL